MKDPCRDMPRAIYISIPIVTFIYVMANVAYFSVISPEEVAKSDAVAVVGMIWYSHQTVFSLLFEVADKSFKVADRAIHDTRGGGGD